MMSTPDVEQELNLSQVYSKQADGVQKSPENMSSDATINTENTAKSEFQADWRLLAIFAALMVVTLAAALDATIISVAL